MLKRCKNKNTPSFENYGGRGIKVCEEWEDFANFLRDMGVKPEGLTLERIENDLGYFKENCKWATRAEQSRNTRRTRFLTFSGKTMCVVDWAQHLKIEKGTLEGRLLSGWSVERALSEPLHTENSRGKR
jgi:hypothetical protein